MEFDSSKATDSDGIPHVLLKRWIVNSVILSTPYSRKYSKRAIIQEVWKCATIVPVHKKNSKIKVTNYRPVSLLSYMSKVFERSIYSTLYNVLRPKFSDCQDVYRVEVSGRI